MPIGRAGDELFCYQVNARKELQTTVSTTGYVFCMVGADAFEACSLALLSHFFLQDGSLFNNMFYMKAWFTYEKSKSQQSWQRSCDGIRDPFMVSFFDRRPVLSMS